MQSLDLRPLDFFLERSSIFIGDKVKININDTGGEVVNYEVFLDEESKNFGTILNDNEEYYLITYGEGNVNVSVKTSATNIYKETVVTKNFIILNEISNELYISFTNLNWSSLYPNLYQLINSSYPSFYVNNTFGQPSLRSANIGSSSISETILQFDMPTSGKISFKYICDSDSSDYFSIKTKDLSTNTEKTIINVSGYKDWTNCTISLTKGKHQLILRYSKNRYYTSGKDACAISDITISNILPLYFLIQENDILYSLDANNNLIKLNNNELNANTFIEFGFSPTYYINEIKNLSNPKILYWWDSPMEVPLYQINIYGNPSMPQIVYTKNYENPSDQIKSIDMEVVGNPLFSFSFDNGITWEVCLSHQWLIITDNYGGMTKNQIDELTIKDWSMKKNNKRIKIKCVLSSYYSSVSRIIINYM